MSASPTNVLVTRGNCVRMCAPYTGEPPLSLIAFCFWSQRDAVGSSDRPSSSASAEWTWIIVFPMDQEALPPTHQATHIVAELNKAGALLLLHARAPHAHAVATTHTARGGAGLETSLFYSTTREEIICKVRASEARMLREAGRTSFELRLDADALRRGDALATRRRYESFRVAAAGPPVHGGARARTAAAGGSHDLSDIGETTEVLDDDTVEGRAAAAVTPGAPMSPASVPFGGVIVDVKGQSSVDPYSFIHGKYVEEKRGLFAKYPTEGGGVSVLRGVDAIKLTASIMKAPADAVPRGAGLVLDTLRHQGAVLEFFPLQKVRRAGDAAAVVATAAAAYSQDHRCAAPHAVKGAHQVACIVGRVEGVPVDAAAGWHPRLLWRADRTLLCVAW